MNLTKIETFDYTWNPLGWGCWGPDGTQGNPKWCWYCYAKRFADRGLSRCLDCRAFVPHVHSERLDEPTRLQKPARIFVCDTADLFGAWLSGYYRDLILDVARRTPRHIFFFLTKQPWIMARCAFPDNAWVGVTVTSQADADERMPPFLAGVRAKRKFVSVEPLLGELNIRQWLVEPWKPDWTIIGALTGCGTPPPNTWQWVRDLTRDCVEAGVPIFHKNSLKSFLHEDEMRREMP